ncbi:MAG TPA: SDR family oxidoreductase [Bauldia sp.]|nr:SDR family oxidoreductase [Bauldia sp.]
MRRLEGRVALVTGASRGYGRAIAERLARDGALVIIHHATNTKAAKETVAAIQADGGAAIPLAAPLDGSPAGIDALFARLDTALTLERGSTVIDILVNNAAISPRGTLEDTTEALFDEVIAIDAKAPFFLIQKVLPRMPDGGRIVNISSQTSLIAFPGVAAYTMAKGALDRLTLVAAKHLAPRGITVNAVLPGIADTDMNANWLRGNPDSFAAASVYSAFRRVADVTDIADIVAFLVSHDARWITGQLIDGGGGSGI